MNITPTSSEELRSALASAHARRAKIGPVDLRALHRVLEYTPEDMTITVEAGITLAALQAHVRERGQWLPLDPPHPGRLTISGLLAANLSGPRRFGFGTARDHVLGLRVALADGTIVHSGGKVVKNVAGYDLMKLFIGARGTLGIVIETTFKLRPLPETEAFVRRRCDSLADAERFLTTIFESPLSPTVLDLHQLNEALTLVLGFAGAREDVEFEIGQARELGAAEPASLEHERVFWDETPPAAAVQQRSVLPSRLIEEVRKLGAAPFVARAGNGVIYHRGAPVVDRTWLPRFLFERVKDAFDPKHIFPEFKA